MHISRNPKYEYAKWVFVNYMVGTYDWRNYINEYCLKKTCINLNTSMCDILRIYGKYYFSTQTRNDLK